MIHPFAWFIALCAVVLLAACGGPPTTVYETTIRYQDRVYLVQEVRDGDRLRTRFYDTTAERQSIGEHPGPVIHYTAADLVAGVPSNDTRIRKADASGDAFRSLMFRAIRDGERQGEARVREGLALGLGGT